MASKLISPEYKDLIRSMHEGAYEWGRGGHKYAPEILKIARSLRLRTVLDYGCGKSMLYRALHGPVLISEYDPGVRGKDKPPVPADMVVTTDVLEHVEPQCIDAVIKHLYELSKVACYAVICTRAASKNLPTGGNAHLIIENADWWMERFRQQPWDLNMLRAEHGFVTIVATRRRSGFRR